MQDPRLADAEQVAHQKTQVPRCDVNQVAFVDLQFAAQPRASGSAGFTDVSETPFHQFAAFVVGP